MLSDLVKDGIASGPLGGLVERRLLLELAALSVA
jgi:hypothetical protein